MNKIILPTLVFLVLSFFSGKVSAQDGYTYTLIQDTANDYEFTVEAVPNTSTNNFTTNVQSYGFTIIVPDGVTIDTASAVSLGGAANATFFDGTNVAQPTLDGYLITETLGSPEVLTAPSSGMTTMMYNFTVNGSPESGLIYILENNSALANAVTPLKSFMQADMIDNGMAEFVNVVDPNAPAVTDPSLFDFATLSTPSEELIGISIYPNPAKDVVYIKGIDSSLTALEIYNSIGQLVATKKNDLNTLNVSQLKSGVYFVKVYADTAQKTFKIIKQ